MSKEQLDRVLATVEYDRAALDGTVQNYRDLNEPFPDSILANHFDVPELAAAVYELADRLAQIVDLTDAAPGDELLKRVAAIAAGVHPVDPRQVVADHLGVPVDGSFQDTGSLARELIYGRPGLVRVTWWTWRLEDLKVRRARRVFDVDLNTGALTELNG
ncbi:hypothetical protein V6N00_13060 [Tersicoccus sp. MR15.9]|uniref:hypothetical protein n=1 Tax=Tersicoccus mangrovi TaxID=3121635 RepID=UPI002FE61FEB